MALATFESFCDSLNIRLKSPKTKVRNRMVFLGIRGSLPRPPDSATLRISHPMEKKKAELPQNDRENYRDRRHRIRQYRVDHRETLVRPDIRLRVDR